VLLNFYRGEVAYVYDVKLSCVVATLVKIFRNYTFSLLSTRSSSINRFSDYGLLMITQQEPHPSITTQIMLDSWDTCHSKRSSSCPISSKSRTLLLAQSTPPQHQHPLRCLQLSSSPPKWPRKYRGLFHLWQRRKTSTLSSSLKLHSR